MPEAPPTVPTNPLDLLRTRNYLAILGFAALIGVPISTIAYYFLYFVGKAQHWVYASLPSDLGFHAEPSWWPLPVLVVAGVVVAAAIVYLPGTGGHEPAAGLSASGVPAPTELWGVVLAAFATLALGAVLGPEGPLIAIGGGLAAWAVHLVKKDAPAQAALVIGAAGSFAAIATLLGSPLVGAFLLMEVSGLAGPLLGVLLVPGLLASGIGALTFVGLDSLTGHGTFTLAIPQLPPFKSPTGYEFLWAIAIGIMGAVLGTAIKRSTGPIFQAVARRRLLLTPVLGAGVAVAAIVFGHYYGAHGSSQVLFSGQDALSPLVDNASTWTVGALVLLIACKSVAYTLSRVGFRGGPTFPALFIGAAGGIALSHLPGLPMVAGAAMGIGAMSVTMLGLPLTSVLLTSVLVASDAAPLTPLIIVSVVVAYVASVRAAPATPPT
jgi:H+/Cl- antiporter ClcA